MYVYAATTKVTWGTWTTGSEIIRGNAKPTIETTRVFCETTNKSSCARKKIKNVTATDLFPFANQCPRQAIRPLIDQSRQSAWIPSSSQEQFFLVPFWVVCQASSKNRPLSYHCYWFHLEPHRWRTRCC